MLYHPTVVGSNKMISSTDINPHEFDIFHTLRVEYIIQKTNQLSYRNFKSDTILYTIWNKSRNLRHETSIDNTI